MAIGSQIRPTYDSHNFTALPRSIAGLLGRGTIALPSEVLAGLPKHYTKVVVILADGFAWHFFERFAGHHPALRRFINRGTATRITMLTTMAITATPRPTHRMVSPATCMVPAAATGTSTPRPPPPPGASPSALPSRQPLRHTFTAPAVDTTITITEAPDP